MRAQEASSRSQGAVAKRSSSVLALLTMLCALQVTASGQIAPSSRAAQGTQATAGLLQDGGSGIKVKSRKSVLFGNAKKSQTPATIDCARALKSTREVRKINEEGITKGSAQYHILMSGARKRLRKVIRKIALAEQRDCVVKKGAIRSNPHKLKVADLTDAVVEALEGSDGTDEDGGIGR